MTTKTPITVAYGDGIGPEIMTETLKILAAAGAQLDIDVIDVGEKVYLAGHTSGIEDAAWASIRRTGVILKSPITTPYGGGYKSLNVTMRKTLGLFANVRPVMSYHPFVKTNFPNMDLVIVRENEEDLYAGIEYRHTPDVYENLKIITRPGSERINRYAFEYAKANGRKKVTCMIKDNIMKMTDGLFYAEFERMGTEYPTIARDRMIIDIGAAKIAADPCRFDVIVTENLYGDIISDIAAEVTGSVGLGGSANVGEKVAMFEAIHGSAPDIAGKNLANPSGLLLGAIMMLLHIGQGTVATRVHNAWLKTIEDGVHTGDIYQAGVSTQKVGTAEFGDAVVARLGQVPSQLRAVNYPEGADSRIKLPTVRCIEDVSQDLVGIDIYMRWEENPQSLVDKLQKLGGDFVLEALISRGVVLWPNAHAETSYVDHMRARFFKGPVIDGAGTAPVTPTETLALMQRVADTGIIIAKMEHLFLFDGQKGFSVGQGQ